MLDNENVKGLYQSGWSHEDPPSDDTESVEWQVWAAGDDAQDDDVNQADFPLGFEKRFELFMEWEYPDLKGEE